MRELFTILILSSLGLVIQSQEHNEAVDNLIKANNLFGRRLQRYLFVENEENYVFSSLSAHSSLSMLYQGARGNTIDSMAALLNMPSPDFAADVYGTYLVNMTDGSFNSLIITNKVFVKEGLTLNETFKRKLTNQFYSEVDTINFTNRSSVKMINEWISTKTRDKIRQVFPSQSTFDGNTKMILINTIYFKARWYKRFVRDENRDFYSRTDGVQNVPMMNKYAAYGYVNNTDLDAVVLTLPYLNIPVRMGIILPHARDGLKKLTTKLREIDLISIIPTDQYSANVTLPLFKIETTIDLQDSIKKMGGESIFYARADFSGIDNGEENLYLSKIIQKTYFTINEKGTEAASATGSGLINYKGDSVKSAPDINIIVDHPFYFFLYYEDGFNSPTIFFQGKVEKIK